MDKIRMQSYDTEKEAYEAAVKIARVLSFGGVGYDCLISLESDGPLWWVVVLGS